MKKNTIHLLVTSFAILLLTTSMLGCAKKADTESAASSSNIISGVAASGAPISNGKVEIKGSTGTTASATTNADGSYQATVTTLTEPYLVRVTAPSGEKYISVASQSDLAEGKKINVTPLTHTIVAKVFQNADADNLYANFETKAADFSPQKLQDEKHILVQKFVDAGLLGSGKIASADVDLLNGDLHAGTSVGVDGLLDVIDVNTSATAGVEIKLKGETAPIFVNKVDGTADAAVVAINSAKLTAAVAQLDVLSLLRIRLNALASLHSSKVACNGPRLVTGDSNPCDIDNLYNAFLPFFHSAYKERGTSRADGLYGWFCKTSTGKDAKSRAECAAVGSTVFFENVYLKDISLINFQAGVALVSLNIYVDGILENSEEMALKEELLGDGIFKLLGDNRSFEYWIGTESVHRTEFNKTNATAVNSYNVNLNFYYQGQGTNTFNGDEVFTLTATTGHQIFPGNSATMNLYLVKGARYDSGSCTEGLVFSTTANPYRVFDPTTGISSYANFATACATSNSACNCTSGSVTAYFDHDVAQKVTLSEAAILGMDKVEKINITIASGATAWIAPESFSIKKPLVINQYNAAQYVPSFGMSVANFCKNLTLTTPLNLSVATGQLNHISLHHNYTLANGTTWANQNDSKEYWNAKSATAVYTPAFTGLAGGETIMQSHLYLSATDEFNRQFIRQVSCNQ